MKDIIILFTKDCMPKNALPCYGGCKYWIGKTPNIDELAAKGTVFHRHYASGGSTAMSVSAMLTGHYCFEFESRKFYTQVGYSEYPSIFDSFQNLGYETHLVWDKTWFDFGDKYICEFGDLNKLIKHGLDFDQPTDEHDSNTYLLEDDLLVQESLKQIYDVLCSIDKKKKQFVWIHLPHIVKGRTAYMSDIDIYDTAVGYAREFFDDDCIYLSTDHGHMNMHKGIAGYGFDVYEPIINIPLITPRINGLTDVRQITSNTDLPTILLENKIPSKHDFVICETKYYGQPGRKIAIVGQRFKYIYNDADKSEELYDLNWDPVEEYNILVRSHYDKDRKRELFYDEHYFYPYKKEAMEAYETLLSYKKQVWREMTVSGNLKMKSFNIARDIYHRIIGVK